MPFLVLHSLLGSSVGVERLWATRAVPALVAQLVSDFPEVPADHQLSLHHLHRLHRA